MELKEYLTKEIENMGKELDKEWKDWFVAKTTYISNHIKKHIDYLTIKKDVYEKLLNNVKSGEIEIKEIKND